MNCFYQLHRLLLISILMLTLVQTKAQFASGVKDYIPAPGQYTNAEFIGTPSAAASLVNTNRGLVSLGAFGGSITLEFSSAIKNDPANPYGVDFTIYGNPTPTWSEPGIVQVMKDENKNGLPDDTWYEIAGSDHYWNTTASNYEVTYFNSGLNTAIDIYWHDNQGKSGIIPANSFHRQSYYPQTEIHPQVPTDKYMLKGTRLQGQIDLSIPGVVNSYRRTFGYADNTPVNSYSEKLPDNPYTSEIEGSGGDAIDINWAVDQQGNHVTLDEIHFIRIYTGMNALVGWLGEISTEITGIRDVEPFQVSGSKSMIVIQDLLPKILLGEIVPFEAILFESGIKVENATISWSVSNPEIAVIENGDLRTLNNGIFQLCASLSNNPAIYVEKEIEVYSAGKAIISLLSPTVKVNDQLELIGKLTDQNGNVIPGITPLWRTSNEAVAEILQTDGTYYLRGKLAGASWLYLESKEIASIRDSIQIQVLPESNLKKVFITVKTSERTLIPRHSVWVETMDLTAKVDRAQKTYELNDTSFVSLADAIAAVYKNTDFEDEWAFRDDAEGGSALYIWRIPEDEEGSTVNHFGYGGSQSSAAYRKTWVVQLNQQAYVSGLDKIRVNNDDEILVYHITDNSIPWAVSHLTSGSDTIKVNQPIEFQLMKYSCSMNPARVVTIKSSEVLANQTVSTEAKIDGINNENYFTDEYGKVMISFGISGQYELISGKDKAAVDVESTTGTKTNYTEGSEYKVYPNPFHDKLTIEGELQGSIIEIADLYGRIIYSASFSQYSLNLQSLAPGIYVLKVKLGSIDYHQKLLKQ